MQNKYQETWYKKLQQRKEKLDQLFMNLRVSAKECALFLGQNYSVKKVYLIGSLLKSKGKIHENSDIDLVVVGLAPEKYFKALAELRTKIILQTEINLIPFENASKTLQERTLIDGEVLFEK